MLTTLAFFPLGAALVLLVIPKDNVKVIYGLSILMTCIPLLMVLYLWPAFIEDATLSIQETTEWASTTGVTYVLGVDGVNLPFLTILTFLAVLASIIPGPSTGKGLGRRSAILLAWESSLLGAFLAQDYVLFLVFWALSTVPIYFLMERRKEENALAAAKTYTLSSLVSTTALAAGLLVLFSSLMEPVFVSGELNDLAATYLSPATQWWIFLAVFVACGLRLPIFPFHIWLPLTMSRLSTSTIMILVGGFIPLSIYCLLRFALAILSDAVSAFSLILALAGLANLLFGSLASLGTDDHHRKASYQIMIYTGTALLATATLTLDGINGALFTMLAMVLAIAYSMSVAVLVSRNANLDRWPLVLYGLDAALQLRLPGFVGFVGLALAFSAIFRSYRSLSLAVIGALLLTAIDYGRILSQILASPPPKESGVADSSWPSLTVGAGTVATLLILVSVVLGLRSELLLEVLTPAVNQIMPLLN
ncbi:MAG: hypothetical protein GX322_01580 [Firmicutes bacterium]|nr:hypothetical protein [Bacillota bacterium]